MNVLEAKHALADKLNIDYDKITQNGLFSAADLLDAIQTGALLAWAYRAWDFTLDALKTTYDGGTYLMYPNTFEDASIFLLTVNEKEWDKKNFADFKRYLQQNPVATDTIWSEFSRKIFPNTNALSVSDEISLYGKLRAPVLTLDTDLLPFSPENDNDENSGNKAIIHFAYADILASDKKKEQSKAEIETKKAERILNMLWAPMAARKSREQHQSRAFFENIPDLMSRNGRNPSQNAF